MITVHTSIDVAARTITWRMDATEPEHEKHGAMCHAIDSTVVNDSTHRLLQNFGYSLVCAEQRPFPEYGFTEYWRPPAMEG